MNLSDEDRERLDELAKLRDSGELTNEEYQSLCWSTIRKKGDDAPVERAFKPKGIKIDSAQQGGVEEQKKAPQPAAPKPTSSAEPPEVESASALSGLSDSQVRKLSLKSITTCTPVQASKRRPSYSRRHTGLIPNITMSGMGGWFKRQRTTSSHAMLFPRKGGAFVTGLLALVGILVGMLAFLQSRPKPPVVPKPKVENPLAAPDSIDYYIQPLFGSLAVQNCKWRCRIRTGIQKKACERGCKNLALANYGRRITLDLTELDPQADAEKIISRCTEKQVDSETFSTIAEWDKEIRTSLNVVAHASGRNSPASYDRVKMNYSNIFEANRRMMLPPSDAAAEFEVTKEMIRVSCLRVNLALTDMALAVVNRDKDDFSAEFYTRLREVLYPKTIDLEKKLLKSAKAKELLGDDTK